MRFSLLAALCGILWVGPALGSAQTVLWQDEPVARLLDGDGAATAGAGTATGAPGTLILVEAADNLCYGGTEAAPTPICVVTGETVPCDTTDGDAPVSLIGTCLAATAYTVAAASAETWGFKDLDADSAFDAGEDLYDGRATLDSAYIPNNPTLGSEAVRSIWWFATGSGCELSLGAAESRVSSAGYGASMVLESTLDAAISGASEAVDKITSSAPFLFLRFSGLTLNDPNCTISAWYR